MQSAKVKHNPWKQNDMIKYIYCKTFEVTMHAEAEGYDKYSRTFEATIHVKQCTATSVSLYSPSDGSILFLA